MIEHDNDWCTSHDFSMEVEHEIKRFRNGEISRQRLVQNLERLAMTENEIYSIEECRRAKEERHGT